MKQLISKKILITWIALLLATVAMAQPGARFDLFTDRDIYSSGETLLLKALVPSQDKSGFIHLDLLGKRGAKINGILLQVAGGEANGYLYLPDSLSTGSYLLRVSARSTTSATFKEIFVVNRFCNLDELSSNLPQTTAVSLKEQSIPPVAISGIGERIATCQQVKGMVNLPPEILSNLEGNLLISIAETTLGYPSKSFVLESGQKVHHLVEKDGMIIEGVVTDQESHLPFKDAVVYCSMPDSIPDFNYYLTGSDGRFYFQLKQYFGRVPIVLQCFDPLELHHLKISLLDPEKWESALPEFSERLFIPDFLKIAAKNRDAVTYRKIYQQSDIATLATPPPAMDPYPFFGVPNHIVYPKLFMDLPDFSEISRELLPGVKFRSYNRIPSLQVIDAAMHAYPEGPPLVVLDGIPVRDLNLIKGLGTKDIEKVEICLSERFFGKISFKGVVAIHTTKAGRRTIPPDDEILHLNLDAIQGAIQLLEPKNRTAHEPDFRQVLMWEPNMKPQPSVPFTFYTSDLRGNYKITVRGRTKDGSIIKCVQHFEVN